MLLLLLWVIGIYMPLAYKKQRLEKEIEQLNNRYNISTNLYKKYRALHTNYSMLVEQYAFFFQKYSPKSTDAQIDFVLTLLEAHNLVLTAFTLDKHHKKIGYEKQDAIYSFTGSIQSVINFLKSVTQNGNLLYCNSIRLEKLSDTHYKTECKLQTITHTHLGIEAKTPSTCNKLKG